MLHEFILTHEDGFMRVPAAIDHNGTRLQYKWIAAFVWGNTTSTLLNRQSATQYKKG
jgi:hypothetical protein